METKKVQRSVGLPLELDIELKDLAFSLKQSVSAFVLEAIEEKIKKIKRKKIA